jgi:hypothetical protein
MTPLASASLWDVWDDLHTARNNACWPSATCGVSRSSRATKPLGELLDKSTADVVSRDMNSVSNAENDERTLGREGQA